MRAIRWALDRLRLGASVANAPSAVAAEPCFEHLTFLDCDAKPLEAAV